MKRIICLLLCLMALPLWAGGEEVFPPREYEFTHKAYRQYDSTTLKYKMETFKIQGVRCYLTKVWLWDPGKQIRKVTSEWRKNIMLPRHMAEKLPEAALVINGSGYWNPTYPDVPENYPGVPADYFYTPWGSLTVTDGEVLRNLEGIPYTGLTLEEDGLHMYVGEETGKVLEHSPIQTWSFRDLCPLQLNGKVLTPPDWEWAGKKARRTVIGRVDRNNYLILSVTTEDGGTGITLHDVNNFFQKYFELEWLYNLDGGPSSALLARKYGKKKMNTVMGGSAKDVDIMAFTELPAAD